MYITPPSPFQDTLFYCTHIPMSAWRSTVQSLIDLLPQFYLFPDPVLPLAARGASVTLTD